MIRKIEYEGMVHSVYTTEKTQVLPDGTPYPDTVLYAAWRWLCHCEALTAPFSALCLGFRMERWRCKSRRFVLTVPGPAAGLAGGYLHLLVRVSCDGVWLEAVQRSKDRRPQDLPHRGKRIFFHLT